MMHSPVEPNFNNARFEHVGSFAHARFEGDAWFSSARFGDVNFGHAFFGRSAHFNSAQFDADANFASATFTIDFQLGHDVELAAAAAGTPWPGHTIVPRQRTHPSINGVAYPDGRRAA